MNYGLQMYSVRDLTEKNLAGALRQVAALGYEFVEFAGFFGHSAADVRRMLAENGLTVSGAHVGLGELSPERIEETIAYHKALGNDCLIVPWESYPTKEKLDEVIDALNTAQKTLSAQGITLGYHNHAFEFEPTAYGESIIDALVNRTQVELEIDTYWVYAAGLDPVKVLESLGERVRMIHVKDGLSDRSGRALGEGTAPVAKVIAYAKKNGKLLVVESEDLNPSGIEEVGRCAAYLKGLSA